MVHETQRNFDAGERNFTDDPIEQLNAVFTYFLQGWFGHPIYAGTGMYWYGGPNSDVTNDETTELIITAKRPELEAIEKVPHVVVVLGGYAWSGLGINQLQTRRSRDGRQTHTDLIPSTVSFHCMAKDGALASRIAYHASFGVVALRTFLMRAGRLHEVKGSPQVSGETAPGAISGTPAVDTDVVSVVASVPFYRQVQWRITRPAPVLRSMRMTLQSRSRQYLPTSLWRAPGWPLPDLSPTLDGLNMDAVVEGDS